MLLNAIGYRYRIILKKVLHSRGIIMKCNLIEYYLMSVNYVIYVNRAVFHFNRSVETIYIMFSIM